MSAQKKADCDQLTIRFNGLIDSGETDQLFFEVSNVMYTGSLYYYPGFLLLNEQGDTIAREEVKYYGIGTSFQTHLLELTDDISFPFVGRLELFGSYYSKKFCSFPIEIEEAEYVSLEEVEREVVKVALNYAGDHVVIDLGGNDITSEYLEYHFNLTNVQGQEVYTGEIDTDIFFIPVDLLGGAGSYYISVWDGINKKLLPTRHFLIE
ncbi:MAG: hypothetical protein DWQ02_27860 [Bacteroidetes bacterium]|nr:MAG: hypothetical protein DWQ02_27860 [Bacteroidota bacterium]